MKAFVSGLVNIETTVHIGEFPINSSRVEYLFFGINSDVSGVGFNIVKALAALGDDAILVSIIGNDFDSTRILSSLENMNLTSKYLFRELKEIPKSIILYDDSGKRKIYCDLKDIQEKFIQYDKVKNCVSESDIIILCNINYNRKFIQDIKKSGKLIASDVHVIESIEDEYNRDFMECADILFLSNERLPYESERFLNDLRVRYFAKVIVIGCGKEGALLYDRDKNKIYRLSAVNIGKVINTVGAGDALFTAFIHYYMKGFNCLDALAYAEVFAAIKIKNNGASIGFCSEQEVEEYYKKVSFKISEMNVF